MPRPMQSPDRAVKAVVSAPQPSFDVPTEQAECREHAAQSTGMVITRKPPHQHHNLTLLSVVIKLEMKSALMTSTTLMTFTAQHELGLHHFYFGAPFTDGTLPTG